ncbi:MAG: Gldg family protein [Clostridia bacterium]|nr:Gldg family protein [Clostridia bacterium]
MNSKNILKSRKFRYGVYSTAFVAVFIAIMIVFNGIFSVLANRFGWYVDMTSEAVFTFSDAAKDYLKDIKSEVTIYFASDADKLVQDDDMRYIYNSAKELSTEFSNIKVVCRDSVKNPEFFAKFKESKGTPINSKSVIIESGTESVVYVHKAFFTYNEDGTRWGYNGEYRYIAGILQVTQAEHPVAYFTVGHSEDVGPETGEEAPYDYGNAAALKNLLTDCGFEVRKIDLTTEEIDDDARIIVIYNPKFDFHGIEVEDKNANEIDKIDKFLDGLGGLMVFEDPSHAEGLTKLNEFLEEWGISFRAGTQVKDTKHSMSTNGYSIKLQYETEDTFGKTVYDDLENFDSMPGAIISQAMPIEKLWNGKNMSVGARGIYTMLSSYDTSELIDRSTNDVIDSGEFDLVTISYEDRVIDNDHYYSYVMAAGSPSFAYNNYLIDGSWGNSDIIFSTMKLIGRDRVLADLDTKPFDDTSSEATTEEAKEFLVCCTVILPAIITITGVVIIIRRKHS